MMLLLSPLVPNPKFIKGKGTKMYHFLESTFSDIYLDNLDKPTVVTKVFKPEKFNKEEVDREMNIMKSFCKDDLLKEHIPKILEYKSSSHMTLEFCGLDGIELVNAEKFTINMWMDFLVQILPVVDRIHQLGFIHCDIKPENVTYREDQKKWYLIDFGLSKQYKGVPPCKRLQGTFHYFSPLLVNKNVRDRFNKDNEYSEDYSLLRYAEFYTFALTALSLLGVCYDVVNGYYSMLDVGMIKDIYNGDFDKLAKRGSLPKQYSERNSTWVKHVAKILAGIVLTQVIPEASQLIWNMRTAKCSFVDVDNISLVAYPTKVVPLWEQLKEIIYNYKKL